MSGGSYNYLEYLTLDTRVDDLKDMHARLIGLAKFECGHDEVLRAGYLRAAVETGRIIAVLDVPEWLRLVWHAVEWRDSADWGQEQLEQVVIDAVPDGVP
jgi:hypothetical protein